MSKDQVITMFYELKDANSGEILESNMQEGGQISFITGHGHIIEKLEEELQDIEQPDLEEGQQKLQNIESQVNDFIEKVAIFNKRLENNKKLYKKSCYEIIS